MKIKRGGKTKVKLQERQGKKDTGRREEREKRERRDKLQ
jgi:hypothetical protein